MQLGAEVYILTTVAGHVGRLTSNLRSPLLLNLNRRLGCQVITGDEQPIQMDLPLAKPAQQVSADEVVRQAA